jgi:hypothetical protein
MVVNGWYMLIPYDNWVKRLYHGLLLTVALAPLAPLPPRDSSINSPCRPASQNAWAGTANGVEPIPNTSPRTSIQRLYRLAHIKNHEKSGFWSLTSLPLTVPFSLGIKTHSGLKGRQDLLRLWSDTSPWQRHIFLPCDMLRSNEGIMGGITWDVIGDIQCSNPQKE